MPFNQAVFCLWCGSAHLEPFKEGRFEVRKCKTCKEVSHIDDLFKPAARYQYAAIVYRLGQIGNAMDALVRLISSSYETPSSQGQPSPTGEASLEEPLPEVSVKPREPASKP